MQHGKNGIKDENGTEEYYYSQALTNMIVVAREKSS